MINHDAKYIFVRQRQAARSDSSAVVHSFNPSEPHNITGDLNEENQLCWCGPEIEDFSGEGGGVLIIHRTPVWQ